MEQFEWNANYATGVTEIDTQHAYLFALVNRLIRYTAGTVDKSDLEHIIAELEDYAGKHFSYEESVMKQAGYEHLEEHMKKHETLRAQLSLYAAELKAGGLNIRDFVEFMKTWLRLHILREDMKYLPAVARLRDGSSTP